MSTNDDTPHRITQFAEWSERTIRCVVENPGGRYGGRVQAVVVFDDDSWSCLSAVGAGCDDEADLSLNIGHERDAIITDYLSADDLLKASMVNRAQYEHLKKLEDARLAEDRQEKAARMLKEAERLTQEAQKLAEQAERAMG